MLKAALLIILCLSLGVAHADELFTETVDNSAILRGRVDESNLRINRGQLNAGLVQENLPQAPLQVSQSRLRVEANHGEMPVGVLGVLMGDMQRHQPVFVKVIFPFSDAANSCRVGDIILSVDGHSADNAYVSRELIRGRPGQIRRLTIARNGSVFDVYVKLTDNRLFINYDYDGYYHWCNGLIKRW